MQPGLISCKHPSVTHRLWVKDELCRRRIRRMRRTTSRRRAQAYPRRANAHLKPVRQPPDGSDERKRKSGTPSFTQIAIFAKKYSRMKVQVTDKRYSARDSFGDNEKSGVASGPQASACHRTPRRLVRDVTRFQMFRGERKFLELKNQMEQDNKKFYTDVSLTTNR